MRIQLEKFGTTLVSRQQGKEAYAAYLPSLKSVEAGGQVEVDFSGVITFSPSWGDEFLSPLLAKYGEHLQLVNIGQNPSVLLTIQLLERIHDTKFNLLTFPHYLNEKHATSASRLSFPQNPFSP